MKSRYEALERTTLLLNRELFSGEADERAIADALLSTTVRFEADDAALGSRAGQTAFVTGVMLTARLGIGIEILAPNVDLIDVVAPLRTPRLVEALVDLGEDLVPDAVVRIEPGQVEETFAFGAIGLDASAPVRVGVSNLAAELTREPGFPRIVGNEPFGGFAAGAAIAAIALDVALPRIEAAVSRTARTPRPSPGPPVRIDLHQLFPGLENGITRKRRVLDVISGGAITHALLFCLLRMPGFLADLRVIEEQAADFTNVNRYSCVRTSDAGRLKTEQLEALSTSEILISGVPSLFTKETREVILPFAGRVLVGVDHVEARWWVQAEGPEWLAVGATGNHLAQLTVHDSATPCAACVHRGPQPPEPIPTISFVSFWAGFLQACALLARATIGRNVTVYPFALGGNSALQAFQLVPSERCPLGCQASKALKA